MLNSTSESNISNTTQPIRPIRIIRLKEVMECTGLGRSSIYNFIAEGTFPKSIPLGGRAVGWLETEINDWVMNKIEERDNKI